MNKTFLSGCFFSLFGILQRPMMQLVCLCGVKPTITYQQPKTSESLYSGYQVFSNINQWQNKSDIIVLSLKRSQLCCMCWFCLGFYQWCGVICVKRTTLHIYFHAFADALIQSLLSNRQPLRCYFGDQPNELQELEMNLT